MRTTLQFGEEGEDKKQLIVCEKQMVRHRREKERGRGCPHIGPPERRNRHGGAGLSLKGWEPSCGGRAPSRGRGAHQGYRMDYDKAGPKKGSSKMKTYPCDVQAIFRVDDACGILSQTSKTRSMAALKARGRRHAPNHVALVGLNDRTLRRSSPSTP